MTWALMYGLAAPFCHGYVSVSIGKRGLMYAEDVACCDGINAKDVGRSGVDDTLSDGLGTNGRSADDKESQGHKAGGMSARVHRRS